LKPHETSTIWKTHGSIKIIDQAQEEVSHLGEEEPRKFKIITRKTHTSTANIMEEAIALKRAQKQKRA
jgi:hypothetical protein